MKFKIKRLLCLTFTILLIGCITACGNQGAPMEETAAIDTTSTDVTEEPSYTPDIIDMNGREFNILLRSTSFTPNDIWSDGTNGEVFNDLIYARNIKIIEDYNVQLNAVVAAEATGNALNTYIQSFIMAGEKPYELLMIRVSDAAKLAQSGIFCNLLSLEQLDFTQAGWQYEKLMETTVNNRLFYATGLITNAANALNICFFNKELAISHSVGDLYELVRDGEFTFDTMYDVAKISSRDLDGDGTMGDNDQFGLAAQDNAFARMLYYASGESIIGKDGDDLPVISIGGNRSINVCERITELVSDKSSLFLGETALMKSMFFEERALFYFASLANAEIMREYDFEFGLLPFPKFDETQEDYYCYLNAHNPCGAVIPITAQADEAAAILQALQFYSQDEVIPAYYEICLKGKQLRDDESAEMLDIIFESWKSDLADAYAFASIGGHINNAIMDGSGIVSKVESLRSQVDGEIQKCVEEFMKIS